jgi:hypothetical protein
MEVYNENLENIKNYTIENGLYYIKSFKEICVGFIEILIVLINISINSKETLFPKTSDMD